MTRYPLLALVVVVAAAATAWSLYAGPSTFAGHTSVEIFGDSDEARLADAAAHEDLQEIDRLLDSDSVDINARGKGGITPLLWALGNGSYKSAELLLQRGADPNAKLDRPGSEPLLSLMVGPDRRDYIELLVRYGADVEITDVAGDAPALEAVYLRKWNAYNALMDAGADPCHANGFGQSVQTYLVLFGHLERLSEQVRKGIICDADGLIEDIEARTWRKDLVPLKNEILRKLRSAAGPSEPSSSDVDEAPGNAVFRRRPEGNIRKVLSRA